MAFEYLAIYKTFESVKDMDTAVEEHIAAHYYILTESERAIVFKLASHSLEHPGACHLKAATIASALEISTKTVYRAISKLESLGIVKKETTVKSKGGQGASIYIILPYNVPASMSERENDEKPCESKVEAQQSENQSSKSFNLLSSKQANNIMSLGNELALQAEKKKEYMNEYQVMLYDFMHSLPLADELKDQLHKCILATKMNDVCDFVKAKDVLTNIICDITNGTLTIASTLRAVFVGAFNKAVGRSKVKPYKSSSIEETADRERPVPFYNWLNERDNQTEICSRPNLENWLEW
ncbi:helix-turn-helix domain-containing protein [Lysinibacillus irui]|uniref:Helix-turn-helix domain-containing protein n=1 Tax=Lysinibacillus irui TaxID=2998077 RepID=A0ABU5NGV6_9BACI|nr:helix-turn-helix domain-containing protein [Lysinibacillus irui]MEA0553787.1 helix-turn-helix domain-containing protein [Lysinibacillus irui]MEA0975271.1 helix-turn-helix domain-containing protein [Lysinibacillus irui]MEA1041425.1 helix-turn-helix domain-containing protein [Lysinibacillus irui]